MKIRISLIFLLFYIILSDIQGQQQFTNHDIDGWTGTIKYHVKTTYSSSLGSSSEEWLLELSVSNGKAVATAVNTFSRSGSSSCHMNTTGSQRGTMTLTNVDFLITEEEGKTYFSIDCGMPFLKGTRTECGKTEEISQGDLGLLIEAIKVNNDKDVISGDSTSIRNTSVQDQVSQEVLFQSVFLSRGPLEAELIVTLDEYDQWLPVPGKTDNSPGSSIDIGLKLQAKGGGEPKLKAKAFELELVNTSKEPGIGLNVPVKFDDSPAFDMAFSEYEETTVSAMGQKQTVPATGGKSGSARINAFDGGAYTTLKAYAILENGKRIEGKLAGSKGSTDIRVPKRLENSRIAEAWMKQNGSPSDESDDDKSPGNQNNGDGLSAYEEYRGIWSEGKYMRLSPTIKELGVQVPLEYKTQFQSGLDLLSKAAGIRVVTLLREELPDDRLFNINSTGKHKQYGLRLEVGSLERDVVGQNEPANKLVKFPWQSEKVVIDLKKIQSQYSEQVDSLKVANATMPYSLQESIDVTVAHELGHGINLDHHGKPSQEVERMIYKGDSARFQVYGNNFKRIIIDSFLLIKKPVGSKNNESSGDLSCIMAYTNAYVWAFTNAGGLLIYEAVPLLPPGKKLCISNAGTGINEKRYFRDAITGNCLSRIKIRDEKNNP